MIDAGSDPWIVENDACERLSHEITELLSQFEGEKLQSQKRDALSGKIRIRMTQFSNQVEQLTIKLDMGGASQITSEEKDRRRRLIGVHLFKAGQMKNRMAAVHRLNLQPQSDRKALFADLGTASWGDMDQSEPESSTTTQTPDNLMDKQKKILEAQDEGLEALSKIISRNIQISTSINTEVNEHNEILVDIAENVDRIDMRVTRETNMVRLIDRKDSTWGYWIVILLLLVVILAVAFA